MKIPPCLIRVAAFAGLCTGLLAAAPLVPEVGPARSLEPDMLGLNGNVMSLPGAADNADFLAAFRSTHAGLFRYPAGTIANTWDWDIGGLDPDVPEADLIDWVRELDRPRQPARPYGIPQIARIHRETGATVVFVLNMLTKDLEHSLRGLRRARDAGIPVRYVELGNELFFNLPLESRVFPTPEDYGRVSNEWILAIKAEFPGVRCAIVAGGRAGHERSDNWTARALAHCPEADAIIVHAYTPSGLLGRERRNITAGTEGTTEAGPPETPAARQARELEVLATPEGYARMMTTAYALSQRPKNYPRAPHQEVWFTEWNLRGDRDAVRGTWANTLFISVVYHGMLQQEAVRLSHYHNVLSNIFGAIFQNENELAHVLPEAPRSTPWALSAGGLATALYGRVATGRLGAQELRLPGVATLAVGDASLPAAFGWRFHGPGGTASALLINLGDQPLTVTAGEALPPHAAVETFTADLTTYVTGPDAIRHTTAALGATLTLPPHSVTLLNPDPAR